MNPDDPTEHGLRVVVQRSFEEEVAECVRGDVILARVAVEVLIPVREVEAEHLRRGAGPEHLGVQVEAARTRAERDVERVRGRIPERERPLLRVGEDTAPEPLHLNELHVRPVLRDHLDSVRHEGVPIEVVTEDLVDVGDPSGLLREDERPIEVRRPGGGHPASHPDGKLHVHASRDVYVDAVEIERGVERGELSALRLHGLRGEVLLGLLPRLLAVHRVPQRGDHHTFGSERLVQVDVDDGTVDEDHVRGRVPVLLHRRADAPRPRLRIVGDVGADAQREGLQVELLAEVRVAPLLEPCRRHRRALVHVERMYAALAHPFGLALRARFGGGAIERLGDALCTRCDRGAHPTLPSISSSISRFSSTAYSSGSSFAIGSMKPRTMSAMASSSLIPRLIR